MNWDDYRKAVDALPFSEDFQERTQELVRQSAKLEKERITMKKKGLYRAVAIAAAAVLLTVSAYAASRWLSPAQVADLAGDAALAQAFESENAVKINQSVETENFCVTLAGLVSGENLSSWTDQADQARTYAVMILESLDGAHLDAESFPPIEYTFTPLVAGFTPWSVNNWTLNAGVSMVEQDGVLYYLLDVQSIEMFADHTVYLAFYRGSAPSRGIFTMAEDGTIAFAEGFEGPHALFTLPLDGEKADPAAVEQFIADSGFDRDWFTTVSPEEPAEPFTVHETETEDGRLIELVPGEENWTPVDELDWLTVDEFAAYVEEELAAMAQQAADGVLSQDGYDREAGNLAQQLEDVRNGSARALRLDGGMSVVTLPASDSLDNGTEFFYHKTENGISVSIK